MVPFLRTTISSVIAVAMTLGIASGQQPKAFEPGPLPLLPAEQAWLATLGAAPAAAGAMDGRHVYIPLQDERVVALDRETGEEVWTREIETTWPPAVGNGRVFIAASDEFHALDAATGETVWRVPMHLPLLAPMAFDTGWLLTLHEQGDVVGMRAADGRELWRQRVGENSRPLSGPVAGEPDTFYVTFEPGQVIAMSLTDGHVLWNQRLPGQLSEPAWGPGRVFVGSTDNFFYALDSDNGEIEWKWRSGGDVIGAAVDKDVVFFASLDNIIRAANRGNGNQRWRKDTGTRPIVAPRAFGRIAVVAGISPTLAAFAAKDGAPLGTFEAPGGLQGPPLLDPDPAPYSVAAVLVMRNGQVAGLHPVGLQFREPLATPPTALPGRVLPREQK